jgi:hypothetical protein
MIRFQIDPLLLALCYSAFAFLAAWLAFKVWTFRQIPARMRLVAVGLCVLTSFNAIIQSGASTDLWTIDPTSKAGRATMYDTTGRDVSFQSKITYACSNTFTPAATPTDLVTIAGSATKTVRVVSVKITTTNTAAGSQQYSLIKRSTADTTGTFVATAGVPLDANDAAATAVCGHYTANPGALGTAVGTINTMRVASPAAIPGSFAGVKEDAGIELLGWFNSSMLDRLVVLRGVAQNLVVNFGGTALVAGQTHAYTVVWIEE